MACQYNTALSALLCGIGQLLFTRDQRRGALAAGVFVTTLGMLTLAQDLSGISFGIDELLMRDYLSPPGVPPGRMAPVTSLCFALIGATLLALSFPKLIQYRHLIAGMVGALSTSAGGVALFGYFTGLTAAYTWGQATRMALPTAVAFLALGAGLISFGWFGEPDRRINTTRWLPVLVGLGALLATLFLWYALAAEQEVQLRRMIAIEAEAVQNEIATQIDNRVRALMRMARRWELRGQPPRSEWEADADLYIRHFAGYQAIEWVDSSFRARWVVPQEGNEAEHDFDMAVDERRWSALLTARDQQSPAISRAIRLADGRVAILIAIPIFEGDNLNGFIVGIARAHEVFAAILDHYAAQGYGVAIFDGAEEVYRHEVPGRQTKQRWGAEIDTTIYERTWRVRVWPAPGPLDQARSPLPEVALVGGVLVGLLFAQTVYLAQHARRRADAAEATVAGLEREAAGHQVAYAALEQQELLARSQARLLDLAHDAIVVRWLNGTISFWNRGAAELYGWQADEAVGQVAATLLQIEFPQPLEQIEAELLREGRWEGELIQRRRDGSLVIVASRWDLERDARGVPVAVLEIANDITAYKQAEAALREAREIAERADRAKSEFLSRMSHELRTPLNAILGFAQLLEMGQLTSSQRESIAHILTGGQHLLTLINEVLDIARIEAGRFALTIEPVRARDLLEESIELMQRLALQREISIDITNLAGAGCDVTILADPQRLRQVFLNLLSNAIKYNRDHGSVAIVCELRGPNRLRIGVLDTGPGIAADQLEKLFTPFERLGADRSGIEGTGLGLALSRRLVEAMGGALEAESAVGRGSAFWVELPLGERVPRQGEREDGMAPEEVSRVRTVLYIEDNLSNLALVEQLMEQRPERRLIAATQGQLGLELARENRPDLILLDLNLPDLHGSEVLRQLRSDPVTAAIPVIIVSADVTSSQIEQLLAEGARAYLTKPLNVRQFLKTIDDLLDAPELA